MDGEIWQRVSAAVDQAKKLNQDARKAFLEKLKVNDPEIYDEVLSLLQHDKSGGNLEELPQEALKVIVSDADRTTDKKSDTPPFARSINSEVFPPRRAGRYPVIKEIARGGMGAVLRVHDEEFGRALAVKVMLPHVASVASSRQMFLREAKITGRLQHPGIPPIHELGELEDGSPYFAMKLIEGMTIADLLKNEKEKGTSSQSHHLQIFNQICKTLAYAHSQGIIHRDLKPGNVMVGSFGEVQVMDWGLAKVVQRSNSSSTMRTEDNDSIPDLDDPDATADYSMGVMRDLDTGLSITGNVKGTVSYMAPEQARGQIGELDERCDVFGLGGILCSLLTGKAPFLGNGEKHPLQQAREGDVSDAFRRIEESGADVELVALAKACLAANRDDRPKDAEAVADAMESYLDGVQKRLKQAEIERAEAQIKATEERKRREVEEAKRKEEQRRRRTQLTAVSVVLLLLTVSTMGAVWGMIQINNARNAESNAKIDAQKKEKIATKAAEAEKLAKIDADTKLQYSRKSNEILGSVFTGLNPRVNYHTLGELRDALSLNLQKAIEELDDSSIGDRLEVARMQTTLGRSLQRLGEAKLAFDVFSRAKVNFESELAPDHPEMLSNLNDLASGYLRTGRPDQALPLYERTLSLTKVKHGADHPDTLNSMNNLGVAYLHAGQLDLALPLLKETFNRMKVKLGVDHRETLTCMNNLAEVYLEDAKLDLALPLLEETLRLLKVKLAPDHPDTLTCMNNLAMAYCDTGKLDLALPLLVETLKLRKVKLNADHPDVLQSMNNLALAYTKIGRLDQALPLYEKTFKLMKVKYGADHPDTLTCMNNLAMCYKRVGKLELALPLLEETLNLTKAKVGGDHPDTLDTMRNLAGIYNDAGKAGLALPLYEKTFKLMKVKYGADHPDTLTCMNNLAAVYLKEGMVKQALPLFEETVKQRKANLGPDHGDTLKSMNNLAMCYERAGKLDLALPLYEEATLGINGLVGTEHPTSLAVKKNLVQGYKAAVQNHQRWQSFLEKTNKIREKEFGDSHAKTLMAMTALGFCYRNADELDKAQPLLEKAFRLREKHLLGDWAGSELVALYLQVGQKATERKFIQSLTSEHSERLHEVKLSAGGLYSIEMNSKDFDTLLQLRDATGKKLAENDDIDLKGKNLNSRIIFIPPAGGIYRLLATSYQNQGRGNYEINIRDFSNGMPVKVVTEKATKPEPKKKERSGKPDAQIIKGQLTKEDPLDTFPMTKKSFAKVHEVEFKKGEIYQIDLTANFDPYLRIETANKVALLDNDDASPPGTLASRIIFSPKEDGNYSLISTSYKPGETGEYKITITPMEKSPHSKSFKEALVKSPQTIQGKFIKLHKLELEADTPYTFHLKSQKFDTFLVVIDDKTKRPVAQNDDIAPGNTKESRIDFTPSRTGSYTILVKSFEPGETGDYELTVQGYEPKDDSDSNSKSDQTKMD